MSRRKKNTAASDASANFVSCPLRPRPICQLGFVVSFRKPSRPRAEQTCNWGLLFKTRSPAPPAGLLRQIRPIPGILQADGNRVEAGSPDGGGGGGGDLSRGVHKRGRVGSKSAFCINDGALPLCRRWLKTTWTPRGNLSESQYSRCVEATWRTW